MDDTLVKLYKKVNRIDFEQVEVFYYDANDPHYMLVGLRDESGNILKMEKVRVSTDSPVSVSPGNIVYIGYDRDGERAVVGMSFTGTKGQGGSPGKTTTDEPPEVINEQYIPLNCHPTNPPSLYVVVRQFIYINRAGVRRELPTALVNLTDAVDDLSSGEQCIAALFLVDDGISEFPTVSVVTSTPKLIEDVLGDDDETEVLSAEPANTETPIYAWMLHEGMPAIKDEHRFRDLRQLINIRSDSDITVSEGAGIEVNQTGDDYEVGIAPGGVDTTQLADDAITLDKIEAATIAAIQADLVALVPTSVDRNYIIIPDPTYYGIRIKAAASQTAAMFRVERTDGGSLLQVNPNGDIAVSSNARMVITGSSGTLRIAGHVISTTTTNLDIEITPDGTGKTVIKNPQIATFADALHNHTNNAGGGQLGLGAIATVGGDANKLLHRDGSGVVVSSSIATISGTTFALVGDGASAGLFATSYANVPAFVGQRAQGSAGSPTVALTGNTTVALNGRGWTGSSFLDSVQIRGLMTEDADGSGVGGKLEFRTVPNNSTTLTLRMTIDQDGTVAIVGNETVGGTLGVTGIGSFSSSLTVGAGLTVSQRVQGQKFLSFATPTMANDTMQSFAVGQVTGLILIGGNTAGGGHGMLHFRATNGTEALTNNNVIGVGTLTLYTIALAGTTGANNSLNLGINNGTFYIENRTGASRAWTVMIVAL